MSSIDDTFGQQILLNSRVASIDDSFNQINSMESLCFLGMSRRSKGLTDKEIEFFLNLSDSELEEDDSEGDDDLLNGTKAEDTLVKMTEVKKKANLFDFVTHDPLESEFAQDFGDETDNIVQASIQNQQLVINEFLSTEDEVYYDLIGANIEVRELPSEGDAQILAVCDTDFFCLLRKMIEIGERQICLRAMTWAR